MRFLLCFLILGVVCFSSEAKAQQWVMMGQPMMAVPVAPVMMYPAQVTVVMPIAVPMKFMGMAVKERRGPLRRCFLGQYKTFPVYMPMQPAQVPRQ